MPAFGGAAAGHEVELKKRSTEEIASGVTTALLILVVVFFTCGSLWLGIFAIPSFFAFFRASVVAISSVREVRIFLVRVLVLVWLDGEIDGCCVLWSMQGASSPLLEREEVPHATHACFIVLLAIFF